MVGARYHSRAGGDTRARYHTHNQTTLYSTVLYSTSNNTVEADQTMTHVTSVPAWSWGENGRRTSTSQYGRQDVALPQDESLPSIATGIMRLFFARCVLRAFLIQHSVFRVITTLLRSLESIVDLVFTARSR